MEMEIVIIILILIACCFDEAVVSMWKTGIVGVTSDAHHCLSPLGHHCQTLCVITVKTLHLSHHCL